MLQRSLTLVLTGLLLLPPWACPCHLLGDHSATEVHVCADSHTTRTDLCSVHDHDGDSAAASQLPANPEPDPEHDEPCPECLARMLTIAHFSRAAVADAPDQFSLGVALPATPLIVPGHAQFEARACAYLHPFPDKTPVYLKVRALLL